MNVFQRLVNPSQHLIRGISNTRFPRDNSIGPTHSLFSCSVTRNLSQNLQQKFQEFFNPITHPLKESSKNSPVPCFSKSWILTFSRKKLHPKVNPILFLSFFPFLCFFSWRVRKGCTFSLGLWKSKEWWFCCTYSYLGNSQFHFPCYVTIFLADFRRINLLPFLPLPSFFLQK